MNPQLRRIFKSIVRNPIIRHSIQAILAGNPPGNLPDGVSQGKYDAYRAFVDYQQGVYAQNNTNLEEQGFQGGVPWVGDLENASVLFLSSNPAITHNQCTPRYYADEDHWSIYPDQNVIVLNRIIEFFTNPLAPGNLMVINNGILTVNIFQNGQIQPRPGGVQFWNYLVDNILAELFPQDANNLPVLVANTVFTEIVPFQSLNLVGVNGALQYCWDDFSSHILNHSAANLWIIVGADARKMLSAMTKINFATGQISNFVYGGRPRTLWFIPHTNAWGGAFQNFVNQVTTAQWTQLINAI